MEVVDALHGVYLSHVSKCYIALAINASVPMNVR